MLIFSRGHLFLLWPEASQAGTGPGLPGYVRGPDCNTTKRIYSALELS